MATRYELVIRVTLTCGVNARKIFCDLSQIRTALVFSVTFRGWQGASMVINVMEWTPTFFNGIKVSKLWLS